MHNRSIHILTMSAICALAGACVPAVEPARFAAAAIPDTASIQRGERFALARCSGCHAVGPSGASPLATAPPLREIGQRYPVDQLGEAFAEGFVTGHPAMPSFELGADQNRDLIAYLSAIQVSAKP